jgi:hypothetical protein
VTASATEKLRQVVKSATHTHPLSSLNLLCA